MIKGHSTSSLHMKIQSLGESNGNNQDIKRGEGQGFVQILS